MALNSFMCLTPTCAQDAKEREGEEEHPVQHLVLPDIISRDKAIEVMKSTAGVLRTKRQLDAVELHEILKITGLRPVV